MMIQRGFMWSQEVYNGVRIVKEIERDLLSRKKEIQWNPSLGTIGILEYCRINKTKSTTGS